MTNSSLHHIALPRSAQHRQGCALPAPSGDLQGVRGRADLSFLAQASRVRGRSASREEARSISKRFGMFFDIEAFFEELFFNIRLLRSRTTFFCSRKARGRFRIPVFCRKATRTLGSLPRTVPNSQPRPATQPSKHDPNANNT